MAQFTKSFGREAIQSRLCLHVLYYAFQPAKCVRILNLIQTVGGPRVLLLVHLEGSPPFPQKNRNRKIASSIPDNSDLSTIVT